MVFTTQVFLFLFFPLSLGAFTLVNFLAKLKNKFGEFLQKARIREIILIAVSFAFYAWAGVGDFVRLLVYVIVLYLLAKWIELSGKKQNYVEIKNENMIGDGSQAKKLYLSLIVCVIGVALLLIYLITFKYLGLILTTVNTIFKSEFSVKSIVAPLGLSFITFSAISYLVDVYRKKATAGNIIDCALYISFFPKIISGPIVLWQDFQKQIGVYDVNIDKASKGFARIIIGFAKKVILADTFGLCLASIGLTGIDRLTSFGSLILYALQIYYDFAGYSDIAIGLAMMFGFSFNDNFNFPYLSKSITEFWRRWHISLGAWFKEYVYFPLGGSRAGKRRTLINLAIVFVLTGVWHGAGANYLLWGAINGACVLIERLLRDKKLYVKTPSFVKYFFTMLIVVGFWQLFRYQDFGSVISFYKILFGITKFEVIPYTWAHYFDARVIAFAVIGILGATVLGNKKLQGVYSKAVATKTGYIVQSIALLLLLVIAVLFMVNSTYSPFIYFQY